MKTSTQLNAKIKNLSKQINVEPQIILRNFMMERFLERVSKSVHHSNFILKGGILIANMIGIDNRSTMDLDATIKSQKLDNHTVVQLIEDIIHINLDDGVTFKFQKLEEIREDFDYPGYRITLESYFDKTRLMLKIDLTTGDTVIPREIKYGLQMIFNNRSIPIMAYNVETVLAEKIETTLRRGIFNTRMRDFYDIYILTKTHV